MMRKISGIALAVAASGAVIAGPLVATAAASTSHSAIAHDGGLCGSYHGDPVYCS